ncbi:MAG: hypothetical protein ACKO8G_02735 [Actinomycetota bacterium]
MFVRYYVDLALPFGSVERAFLADPGEWLPGMAHDADERGDRLLGEVGFGQGPRIGKRVEVEVGEPAKLHGTTLLPIAWKATATDAVFPSLEADLEIAALGPDRTQLSISARYRPPMGGVGRVLDRALLHRVAEATLKDFLDRVGEGLSARVLAASGG